MRRPVPRMADAREAALWSAAAYVSGGGLLGAAESAITPPRRPKSPLLPGGAVIGVVWSTLFAGFGLARARLRGRRREQRLVDGLWLLCATYPLYTGGMRWRGLALLGNAVVGSATVAVASEVARARPDAARLIWPALPWVAWATLGLMFEPRQDR